MILERLLRRQGYLDRMLNALSGLFRDRRIVMAILPGFIGLMPSAGGALFSAPLVEQAVGKTVAAEDKAFINFYYRHIWEFFLPIYPGVLLASHITGIPLSSMILGLFPFGILVILIGLPYLFSIKVDKVELNTSDPSLKSGLLKDVIASTLPVIVVVSLVLASVNITLAVALVVGFLVIKHRYTPMKFLVLAREAIVIKTLVIIWAIMFFKEVMASTGSIDELPLLLSNLPIPEVAVAGLISFLVAYLTGQTGFYVGIAFPVVVAAMGGQVSLPLAVFVFVTGSAGTMLSPMHLCLSLTIDYFKADLNKVLRKLILLESILILTSLTAYLILS
jgi:integral membrane protein (TIGR00529 family)